LELPRIGQPPRCQRAIEVLVDYSKSIILTRDEYINMMQEKERRKEAALKEKEADKKKVERQAQKLEKVAQREQKGMAVQKFKAQWTADTIQRARQVVGSTEFHKGRYF
jgi:hypothetical protein